MLKAKLSVLKLVRVSKGLAFVHCVVYWNQRAHSFFVGMFALRERRVHVTQEDFEMAVGKLYFLNQSRSCERTFSKKTKRASSAYLTSKLTNIAPKFYHLAKVMNKDSDKDVSAMKFWK